jgi:hypothetical protein
MWQIRLHHKGRDKGLKRTVFKIYFFFHAEQNRSFLVFICRRTELQFQFAYISQQSATRLLEVGWTARKAIRKKYLAEVMTKTFERKNTRIGLHYIGEGLCCGRSHFEANSSRATHVEIRWRCVSTKRMQQAPHPEIWDSQGCFMKLRIFWDVNV